MTETGRRSAVDGVGRKSLNPRAAMGCLVANTNDRAPCHHGSWQLQMHRSLSAEESGLNQINTKIA
jgi:hypothetical protein